MNKIVRNLTVAMLFLTGNIFATDMQEVSWKKAHSQLGMCHLEFPCLPKRVSESKRDPSDQAETRYDAYVATPDQASTYMLLITHYPEFVDESYAKMGLESFLNGVLSQDSNNELISASMVAHGGQEALDFLIRTGTRFFKGRGLIQGAKLYLMALEVEIPDYNDVHYERFVNSFNFKVAG